MLFIWCVTLFRITRIQVWRILRGWCETIHTQNLAWCGNPHPRNPKTLNLKSIVNFLIYKHRNQYRISTFAVVIIIALPDSFLLFFSFFLSIYNSITKQYNKNVGNSQNMRSISRKDLFKKYF